MFSLNVSNSCAVCYYCLFVIGYRSTSDIISSMCNTFDSEVLWHEDLPPSVVSEYCGVDLDMSTLFSSGIDFVAYTRSCSNVTL